MSGVVIRKQPAFFFAAAVSIVPIVTMHPPSSIQLLECIIHAAAAAAPYPSPRHKKSGWRYLGNKKSYRRSAGVKTNKIWKAFQIFKK